MTATDTTRRSLLQVVAALSLLTGMSPRARSKDQSMRVLITGSTDGLGRHAAQTLMAEGHQVFLHARSPERAKALSGLLPKAGGLVTGDLSSAVQTRALAEQANKLGRMDAVIHNAGIYREATRANTPEGHARILAVNVLAPYLLTGLIERPERLVYLSSGMHRGGEGPLRDIDWQERAWDQNRAYSESKLYVTALAFAVARHWPGVFSNAVDPGWVPTRMGGPGAPDDLEKGHLTQTWLATSQDPAARVSGKYWHHRQPREAARQAMDPRFQDELLARLHELTGYKFL